jgi:membrane protease YdiL (CAAX protease family)
MSPAASPADASRAAWRISDALLAVFVGLVAALVAALVLGPDPDALAIFAVLVPAQTLGTLGTVAVIARNRPTWRAPLSWGWDRTDWIGILIGAGLQIGLSVIAYWLVVELFGGEPPTQDVVEAAAEAISGPERLLVFVGVVMLGPFAEEVVFRGILLGALRQRRTDRSAIVISAAAFAALHLMDPNAVLAVPFLFVLGLVMGSAVVTTGRLARAVAIHAGFNLVSVLALFAG